MGSYVGVEAMQKYLAVEGNPLIDLRCLDEKMGEEMEARYTDAYDQAPDGDPTPDNVLFNQMFAPMAADPQPIPQTKGDVLRAWATELRAAFPKAAMKHYTREEACTMLTLLNKTHMDGTLYLQFSPGFRYNIFSLMSAWNEAHPDETPISFSGYEASLP